jgi:hypothetical protein
MGVSRNMTRAVSPTAAGLTTSDVIIAAADATITMSAIVTAAALSRF